MNANEYAGAIKLSTLAAMKSGLTLPEIIGTLELAKINVERMAYQRAMSAPPPLPEIVPASVLPPNPPAGN